METMWTPAPKISKAKQPAFPSQEHSKSDVCFLQSLKPKSFCFGKIILSGHMSFISICFNLKNKLKVGEV